MCDYSLENVASRAALVSDQLVSTRFAHTVTRGFAALDDPNTAVCLRPGTELAFQVRPRYRTGFWARKAPSAVARFRRIDTAVANAHHDALEFSEGTIVRVAHLLPGQRATVLQLPKDDYSQEAPSSEALIGRWTKSGEIISG